MSDSDHLGLFDRLAEEFAERYRRGERPSLTEYANKYPALADDIQELFPALVDMEVAGIEQKQTQTIPPLEQVGDYHILREIGRGGMGVVYEAEQLSLRRRVALKVLRLQAIKESNAAERFRREARAAAKLHHTNIVPVFEVGQDGDTCFYAMQFIQGQGLDQVIAELKKLEEENESSHSTTEAAQNNPHSSTLPLPPKAPPAESIAQSLLANSFPKSDLSGSDGSSTDDPQSTQTIAANDTSTSVTLPGSADLTVAESNRSFFYASVARIGHQVTQALSYAHERGIVHRDIKPSNLLLDASGVVWVTDFGLAKTDDEALTHTGDVLGTIRYMAPERFKGVSNNVGDLYSLGLTLYELLVLQPAFEYVDRLKLIEMVTNQDPLRPRTLDDRVPRDLETIVLKAIDKDPNRRYQSSDEMGDDLLRFINDEPIRARRVSSTERLMRWGRRNPAVAALAISLLIVFLAGFASVTALWRRAEKLRDDAQRLQFQAEQNFKRAERNRQQAELNFQQARSAVDSYLTSISESALLKVPGLQPLRRDLLDSALEFYEDFAAERNFDDDLRKEVAAARLRTAQIYQEIYGSARRNAETRQRFQEVVELYEAIIPVNADDSELRAGLATAYSNSQQFTEAIAQWENLLESDPDNELYREQLAATLSLKATVDIDDRRYEQALQATRRLLDIRAEHVRRQPDDMVGRSHYAVALNAMGRILALRTRWAEGMDMFRRSIEQADIAFRAIPEDLDCGRTLANACLNLAQQARFYGLEEEALRMDKRGARILQRLASSNPALPTLQAWAFNVNFNLSRILRDLDRPEESANSYRRTREILERLPKQTSQQLLNLATVLTNSATLLLESNEEITQEQRSESKQLADQALDAVMQAWSGEKSVAIARRIVGFGGSQGFAIVNRRPEFRGLLAEARRLVANPELAEAPNQTEVEADRKRALSHRAAALYSDSIMQISFGKLDNCQESLEQARRIQTNLVSYKPDNLEYTADLAMTEIALGDLAWVRGNLKEAEQIWQGCSELIERVASGGNQTQFHQTRLASALKAVAWRYLHEGLWERASDGLYLRFKLAPDCHYDTYITACSLAHQGNHEAYQEVRKHLLKRFARAKRDYIAERTAKACLLLPIDGPDLEQVTSLAQRALDNPQTTRFLEYFRMARGFAHYRAGEFEQAAARLQACLGSKATSWNLQLPAHLMLAMSEKQMGLDERARKTLSVAQEIYDRTFPSSEHYPAFEAPSEDTLICRTLLREAYQTVSGTAPPERPRETAHRAEYLRRLGDAPR